MKSSMITPQQVRKYNDMIDTLMLITRDFQTPKQLYKGGYASSYEDALEMAYDNIKIAAKRCVKRTTKLKVKE